MRILLFLSVLWLNATSLWACPCGCSSQSSVALFEDEWFQAQVTTKDTRRGDFIGARGRPQEVLRPTRTQSVSLGLTTRVYEGLVFGLVAPIERNSVTNVGSHYGVSDLDMAFLLGCQRCGPKARL